MWRIPLQQKNIVQLAEATGKGLSLGQGGGLGNKLRGEVGRLTLIWPKRYLKPFWQTGFRNTHSSVWIFQQKGIFNILPRFFRLRFQQGLFLFRNKFVFIS